MWDNEFFSEYLEEQEKHYGLKLISQKAEILVVVEYTNIIWNYKIFYSSYKKKFYPLTSEDDRWLIIENQLEKDLKTIGLEELKIKIIKALREKEYFEHKEKIEKQFKNYCI